MTQHLSFSYSQISTAFRCNQLYKLLYVDRMVSSAPTSGDMRFGTAVHLGVETILRKNGDGLKDFDLFWNLEKNKKNRYGRFTWDELQEQGVVLLERFKRLHAKNFEIHTMEERFYGKLGDINIEGTPDFVGNYKGVPSVIDFKTSGSRYSKDKPIISAQLALYNELIRQNTDFKAQQVVYFVFIKGKTPSIQVLQHSIGEGTYSSLLRETETYCNELSVKIRDGGPFVKNFNSCLMGDIRCEFWDNCHKGDKNE